MARLDTSTLSLVPVGIRRPRFDRAASGVGIVHLGLGAFARAHQAIYTDDALEAAGGDWSIAGVSLPCVVLVLYRVFPDAFGGVTLVQKTKIDPALRERFLDFGATFANGHATLVYVGVFSAPLVLMLLAGERSRQVLGSKP